MKTIPASFRCMARRMYQDIDLDFRSEEELTRHLGGLTREQRAEVGDFLSKLLGAGLTAGELRAIWDRTNPDWTFRRDGARRFFIKMRDATAAGEAAPR